MGFFSNRKGKGGKRTSGTKPKKPVKTKPVNKSEKYPHFRHYLKSNHPALITGERPIDEYDYRKVMHSERDGGRPNEKVEPNPDPKDSKPMYIAKRIRHDKKKHFAKDKLPWKYPGNKKKK